MSTTNQAILWPTVALAGLIFVVWSILLRMRFAHIAANRPTAADFANAEAVGRYLFEMPVLYFALVPLLMLTGSASAAQVALAWIFVALRVVHSVIHIGPNTVRTRARVYIASSIALFAMWVGFAVDLLAITGSGA